MAYKALDLTGKVAAVIGGTSGIERAIAHGLVLGCGLTDYRLKSVPLKI